jgi:fructokinase
MNKKPNILIYGEALIDEFLGQKVVGGGPLNVARTLSLLGDTPLLISRLGDDDNAQLIQAEMLRTGLMSGGVQIDAMHPTGRVLLPGSDGGDTASHPVEVLGQQAYAFIEDASVADLLDQYFQEAPPDLIYFGSLILSAPQSKQTLLSLLESDLTEGATKFLDLNLGDERMSVDTLTEALNYADIVKLNERALEFVIANCCQQTSLSMPELSENNTGLQCACELLMRQFFMQAVIVTLDEKGYFYFDADAQVLSSLPNDKAQNSLMQMTDAVNTEDAFSAMFIHGWNQSWRMQKTLAAAHEFATAIVKLPDAMVENAAFYQARHERLAS